MLNYKPTIPHSVQARKYFVLYRFLLYFERVIVSVSVMSWWMTWWFHFSLPWLTSVSGWARRAVEAPPGTGHLLLALGLSGVASRDLNPAYQLHPRGGSLCFLDESEFITHVYRLLLRNRPHSCWLCSCPGGQSSDVNKTIANSCDDGSWLIPLLLICWHRLVYKTLIVVGFCATFLACVWFIDIHVMFPM